MNNSDLFKIKMVNKFGDIFDFTDTEYTGSKIKVNIKCNRGHIFSGVPSKLLTYNIPCKQCRIEDRLIEEKAKFINKAIEIHGDRYNYNKVDYINNKTEVDIICKDHGIFKLRPDLHIYHKNGCPICYKESILTFEKIKIEANKVHSNEYNYIRLVDNYKIEISCDKHGLFIQNIYNHLNGCGCPNCNNSKGEKNIERYLIENNIKYTKQKRFDGCKNKRTLPFDFYLDEINTCIEYDGFYHFNGDKYIQNNDDIKTKYCIDNNITLLRFNQSNIKQIDDINRNNRN